MLKAAHLRETPYNKRPRLLPSLYNNSLFVTRTRELALIHAASLRRGKQSGVEERDGPFQDNDERPAVCEAFGRRISSRVFLFGSGFVRCGSLVFPRAAKTGERRGNGA